MFDTQTYRSRREKLAKDTGTGLLLFPGNGEVGMNYAGNPYPFRQDSNFLYFFGIDRPGLFAVLDADSGKSTLFGDELTMEDIVWIGPQPSLQELAERVGIEEVLPLAQLEAWIEKVRSAGRTLHFTPPYRADNLILLRKLAGIEEEALKNRASEGMIKAIVAQRACKSAEEVAAIEEAVNITRSMHIAVMQAAAEGKKESELAGIALGIAYAMGRGVAYGIILSVNGHILHNHYHGNTLQKGQLVLGDFGAEGPACYAGDITRTFPVDKRFTARQRDIYQIVLDAEQQAIDSLRPGLKYFDVHMAASRTIAEGLKNLGLMKGDVDEAVAQGAHALFFPHGLGHMLGLDVHDMEDLGENYVGYAGELERSTQFGTAYLRLARSLQPGFVLTVEPGIYFIPELIDQWRSEGRFKDFIDYEKLEAYRNFGGVRIEDDVLITDDGHRLLGKPIPKTIDEVEALRNG
ncbi:MAG: Xaa-Pro aminopeptidase [Saprospiraceae bacterium]|nr:MAG: Xaa-Pro aminopeptidase [Saprospiraceae bacterium]